MINRLDRLSHQQNDQLKDFLPGKSFVHRHLSFVLLIDSIFISVKESTEISSNRRPTTHSSNGVTSSSTTITTKEKRKYFPLETFQHDDDDEDFHLHSQ